MAAPFAAHCVSFSTSGNRLLDRFASNRCNSYPVFSLEASSNYCRKGKALVQYRFHKNNRFFYFLATHQLGPMLQNFFAVIYANSGVTLNHNLA
jgi:hypothetical protein